MGFSCRYGAGVFFLSFSFFPPLLSLRNNGSFFFLVGGLFCNGLAVVRVNMLHARCNVSFLQFMFGVLKKREWGVGSGAGGGEVIGCYHCSAFYLSVSWFFFFGAA